MTTLGEERRAKLVMDLKKSQKRGAGVRRVHKQSRQA